MKVINTSKIPNALVREVLRFVSPPGLTGHIVTVKSSQKTFRGRAYVKGCGYHFGKQVAVCAVGAPDHFPYVFQTRWSGRQWLASRAEALVFVAAHELRHLWQARVPKGHRAWGSRGQFSEVDCDAYGLKMLRAWRRRNLGKT